MHSPGWVECVRQPVVGGGTRAPARPQADAVIPAAAEGVGAEAHGDSPTPVTTAARAARDHDQRVRPHPRFRGEVDPQGDGPVRQQHHLSAVPVPQPAGMRPPLGCWHRARGSLGTQLTFSLNKSKYTKNHQINCIL